MRASSTARRHKAPARLPWKSLLASARAYYRADTLARIAIVKRGVPALFVATVTRCTGMPKESLYRTLGLARAAVDRKMRNQERLSQDESERLMSMVQIIAHAEKIVQESGEPEAFDAAKWFAAWVSEPHPALGGPTPGEFMDTAEGRTLVSNLLTQQQASAYA